MFSKECETNFQHDKIVMEISFSERNGDFLMEIQTINGNEAMTLKGDLIGLRGIYNMDTPIKQNFNVECDKELGTVKVIGNILMPLSC